MLATLIIPENTFERERTGAVYLKIGEEKCEMKIISEHEGLGQKEIMVDADRCDLIFLLDSII